MRGWGAIWTLAASAAVWASLATAATLPPDPSREEYVAAAEAICKRNVEANRRIFQGAEEKVEEGRLKAASAHFFTAAREFAKASGEVAALPRPAADRRALAKWLALLRVERKLLVQIGEALRAEDRRRAESISVSLDRNSAKANNAVLSFGFKHCRIEPSRFG